MEISKMISKHLREVYFGGNWTCVNFKEVLNDVDWTQATRQVNDMNTIAVLMHHVSYYVTAQIEVLKGNPLNAKDADSFDHPPIHAQKDWDQMLDSIWRNVENLAQLIEVLPTSTLTQVFQNEKYGHYYRNLQGAIEHAHYHLGQIVLLKKLLKQ
ncbi:MAG: DUF1572 family protein [Saprospiraceae bacterium]|nr:DUF1572 family protein [Saprospiraceae bacterium]